MNNKDNLIVQSVIGAFCFSIASSFFAFFTSLFYTMLTTYISLADMSIGRIICILFEILSGVLFVVLFICTIISIIVFFVEILKTLVNVFRKGEDEEQDEYEDELNLDSQVNNEEFDFTTDSANGVFAFLILAGLSEVLSLMMSLMSDDCTFFLGKISFIISEIFCKITTIGLLIGMIISICLLLFGIFKALAKPIIEKIANKKKLKSDL